MRRWLARDPEPVPPPLPEPVRQFDVALSLRGDDGAEPHLLSCLMDEFEHRRLVLSWVNQDARGSYRLTIGGEACFLALELTTITRILAKPIEAPCD